MAFLLGSSIWALNVKVRLPDLGKPCREAYLVIQNYRRPQIAVGSVIFHLNVWIRMSFETDGRIWIVNFGRIFDILLYF